MILANSLVDGFLRSNGIGMGIVIFQLVCSVFMVATIFGKGTSLLSIQRTTRRFQRDFATFGAVLDYYMKRRPTVVFGIEGIYKETCERLLKLLTPDARSLLARMQGDESSVALTAREIELVRGTCDHVLEEEIIKVERLDRLVVEFLVGHIAASLSSISWFDLCNRVPQILQFFQNLCSGCFLG